MIGFAVLLKFLALKKGRYMSQDSHEVNSELISRNRLEFLFDGIFAIAMTILVLELKVPDLVEPRSVSELGEKLLHHGATFGSYLLSFLMLGVMWYRHNTQYRYIRVITRGILSLQFIQLAFAAFFPFCAALLGRYTGNRLPMVIYVGCIMICQWGGLVQWLIAAKQKALLTHLTTADYRQVRKRNMRSSLVTLLLFVIALAYALKDMT
jgi:uncharacterized membrane protein